MEDVKNFDTYFTLSKYCCGFGDALRMLAYGKDEDIINDYFQMRGGGEHMH